MQTNAEVAKKPRRGIRWRRWLLGGFCSLILFVGVTSAKELFARWQASTDLEKIIADLDRLDPRWRLEEIEADRRLVPPEKNSATIVLAANRLLPNGWQDWQAKIQDELKAVSPPFALRQDQVDKLTEELQPLVAASRKARELKDYLQGRFHLQYSANYFDTPLLDQGCARRVAALLNLDVARLLHSQELLDAWQANEAMLNAARSLGDEPSIATMFSRLYNTKLATRNLERILGQGELKAPQLEEMQQALREESQAPLFAIGMRGERAGIHRLFSKLESGELSSFAQAMPGAATRKQTSDSTWWGLLTDFFAYSMVLRSHAVLLEWETKAVEKAKLPPVQRYVVLNNFNAKFLEEVPEGDKSKAIARLLFPSVNLFINSEQETHTLLACAVAGLGAERFRLQLGRWPGSLDELAKTGFLKEVPLDLIDGKPLRFRRAKDGVVIYSISKTGRYDGKGLDEEPSDNAQKKMLDPSNRIEFRLWDVAHRRKAPPPQVKQQERKQRRKQDATR
jgi:hypothetical protein